MRLQVVVLTFSMAASASAVQTTNRSLGTIISCPSVRSADSPCLWAGENGQVVDSRTLRELFIQRNNVADSNRESSLRNLQEHMTYIEDVNMHAKSVGHEFSYHMGVNERHLTSSSYRKLRPEQFVEQEKASALSRRLQTLPQNIDSSTILSAGSMISGENGAILSADSVIPSADSTIPSAGSTIPSAGSAIPSAGRTTSTISGAGSSKYWNWCDSANSMGYDVCSPVKSQKTCGSCWSFVAADAIETAVVIAENASAAVSLSPQQFLMCSKFQTTQTFKYCWASDSGVPGASWMQTEIMWESQNDGCNGGMTHGAFMDAAQNGWGLVTELTMPYDDAHPGSSSATNASSMCSVSPDEAAASITGYEQIVGLDCTVSSDCKLLLRLALEKQPIAVAITSNGGFGDYAGGFYNCPNNGEMVSKNDLNHALLLVGYGTDSLHGDYWILKNSYGSSWGDSGFLKLVADTKINCGLNIFPVIPIGAKAGAQARTTVDSGGDKIFVGLSPSSWIAVAAGTTIFTVVATAIGMLFSQRKMKAIRKQRANGH